MNFFLLTAPSYAMINSDPEESMENGLLKLQFMIDWMVWGIFYISSMIMTGMRRTH